MLNTLTGCERYYLVSRGTLVAVRLTDNRDTDPLSDSSLYALILRANSTDFRREGREKPSRTFRIFGYHSPFPVAQQLGD